MIRWEDYQYLSNSTGYIENKEGYFGRSYYIKTHISLNLNQKNIQIYSCDGLEKDNDVLLEEYPLPDGYGYDYREVFVSAKKYCDSHYRKQKIKNFYLKRKNKQLWT